MNIGEIASLFIRAAEVERATPGHVGPAPLRAQQLPYVHTYADKAGWRKEPGDKLANGADPLAEERKAFWERMGLMATSEELQQLEGLYAMLMLVEDDGQRRALLAWARSKVGGKSFRRWCFQVEGIHPETGRRRKDRALTRIHAQLARSDVQNSDNGLEPLLPCGPEIEDISSTLDGEAGRRETLNSWMAEAAVYMADAPTDFSWAAKRNERRRQQAAAKRKREQKAA